MSRILDRLQKHPSRLTSLGARPAGEMEAPKTSRRNVVILFLACVLSGGVLSWQIFFKKPLAGVAKNADTSTAAGTLQERNSSALKLYQDGELERAATELSNLIAANSDVADLYINLAMVLKKQNKLAEAKVILE